MTVRERWQHFWSNIAAEYHYETKAEMRERFDGVAAHLRHTIEGHRNTIELLAGERDAMRTYMRGLQERNSGYERQIGELTDQLAISQAPAEAVPWCISCKGAYHRADGPIEWITFRHNGRCPTMSHDELQSNHERNPSQATAGSPFHLPATLPDSVVGYDGDALEHDVMGCEETV